MAVHVTGGGQGEDECPQCYWSPRMESSSVFVNRKFLFPRLRWEIKRYCSVKALFLPLCDASNTLLHPQRVKRAKTFSCLTKCSPRPHFQAEWASRGHLPHPQPLCATFLCPPTPSSPAALPSPSPQEQCTPFVNHANSPCHMGLHVAWRAFRAALCD